jgi:deoxyribonuclease-4
LLIGLHTSRAGSLENAALEAHELGANTFQIFSASPRMWRAAAPHPLDIQRFRAARERLGLGPVAIHCNYLVNLASIDPVVREKSVKSFHGELTRAAAIGAEYLVVHPGNYKDQPLEQGLAAFVLGLAEAARDFDPQGVTVLLENTVGSGHQLGSKLEELRMMRDLASRETELLIGYCLDTCHLLAAGFDIAQEAGLATTLAHADKVLGLELVKVIHANDSKGGLGSHLDRHENIGKGQIGEAGFRRILTDARLRDKPFILETPAEDDADRRRDVEALKRLAAGDREHA